MVEIDLVSLFGPEAEGVKAVFVFCPFHGDSHRPNLAVYRDGTYCFACGYRESPEQFLARVARDPSALLGAKVASRGPLAGGGKGKWSEAAVAAWHSLLWEGRRRSRLEWLVQRGISLSLAKDVGLGHTGEAFVLPYRDRHGRLVGWKLRADPAFTDEYRYRNAPGLRRLLYRPRPGQGPLALAEGELDALLLASYGLDSLTVSTGVRSLPSLVREQPWLLHKEVYLFLDQDEAGEAVALQLLSLSPLWKRASWPEGKDISEWLTSLPFEERGRSLDEVLRWSMSSSSLRS